MRGCTRSGFGRARWFTLQQRLSAGESPEEPRFWRYKGRR
jgi:hypothetical protein